MNDWQPSADHGVLLARAEMLAAIREFFRQRDVLEVETPLLSGAAVSDLHLESLSCLYHDPSASTPRRLYLQTSPEYAMKRLLAAGSGAIYQISRAFRDAESGREHNPEFTLLEWYRPGFDYRQLMREVDDLLRSLLGFDAAEEKTYAQLFLQVLSIDLQTVDDRELHRHARDCGFAIGVDDAPDRDTLLEFLFADQIAPGLGFGHACMVYDYPAAQSALARLRADNPAVAERFEVYVGGMELANGFSELTDAAEQRRRFEHDLQRRCDASRPDVAIDERFLAALEAGLPDCAGVALGLDRLLMQLTGITHIDGVLAFPVARA